MTLLLAIQLPPSEKASSNFYAYSEDFQASTVSA